MYWWQKAALLVAQGRVKRFGLITTNSIVQDLSRPVLDRHLLAEGKVSLVFAIADHPWVDSNDGAAVRVAMTVAQSRKSASGEARLGNVVAEDGETTAIEFEWVPRIGPRLQRALPTEPVALTATSGMCFQGVVPTGDGFKLGPEELARLGYSPTKLPPVIRRYMIGRDLVQRPETRFLIDFFSLDLAEVRDNWPALYQHILHRVKPERDQNHRKPIRELWWHLGWERPVMRRAIARLSRYIGTPYTAKHRPFIFLDSETLPDAMIYAIASDQAAVLGTLSSRHHHVWCLSQGGTLEDRPRYTSSATFDPFPFPAYTPILRRRVGELGESLDAHRKRQQAAHPALTITDMYNVLEKLRKNEELTNHDRMIHEQGLVSVLKQIHDDLDAAVAAAYGWPVDLSDEQILQKLVALNAERAEEEKRGIIRWLRPEFQNPGGAATTQQDLGLATTETKPAKSKGQGGTKPPWPKDLVGQISAVRSQLATATVPLKAVDVAKAFKSAKAEKVAELLAALEALGQARKVDGDRFAA
jgi:hypothetical protein